MLACASQDPKNYNPPIADLTEQQVADIVHGDICNILLKPDAPQPKILGVRKWMKAIPQYNKGYFDIRARYRGGPCFDACFSRRSVDVGHGQWDRQCWT